MTSNNTGTAVEEMRDMREGQVNQINRSEFQLSSSQGPQGTDEAMQSLPIPQMEVPPDHQEEVPNQKKTFSSKQKMNAFYMMEASF